MKKYFCYFGVFFIFFLSSADLSFAAEGSGVIKTAGYIVAIASVFTYLVGIFLDPGWLNGSMFGMHNYFKDIWILVSNVVYFIFAFLLIWIAFMNIIGKGQDKYQLKQALPKFIVGVLIVPLSWFIVQFILSLSAILTTAALTLPNDTLSHYKTQIGFRVPKECNIDLKEFFSEKAGDKSGSETEKVDTSFDCNDYPEKRDDDNSIPLSQLIEKGGIGDSVGGLIASYSFGILNIGEVQKLAQGNGSSLGDAIGQLVLDTLFILVFSILIIALVLVLIVRGIYIWLFTMLAPVFGLMYFFGKNEGGEGFFSKFNFKEFISLALVPVYVMLSLSFGILFLSIISHGGMDGAKGEGIKTDIFSIDPNSGENSETLILGKKDSGTTVELTISGLGFTKGLALGGDVASAFSGFIGKLLLNIFGVVVFWIAIMSALRHSTITKAVVEPLASFGGQVGTLVAKSPQYLPIFGGQSMTSTQQIGSAASTYYTSTKPGESARNFMQENKLFGNQVGVTLAADKLKKSIDNGTEINTIAKNIKDVLKEGGDSLSASRNEKLVDSLLHVVKSKDYKVDAYKDKTFKDIKGNQEAYVKLVKVIDEKFFTLNGSRDLIIDDEGNTNKDSYTASDYDEYIDRLKGGGYTGGGKGSSVNISASMVGSGKSAYFDINIGGNNQAFVKDGEIFETNGMNQDSQVERLVKILKNKFADTTDKDDIVNFIKNTFRITSTDNIDKIYSKFTSK